MAQNVSIASFNNKESNYFEGAEGQTKPEQNLVKIRAEKVEALKAGLKGVAGTLVLGAGACLALNSWIVSSIVMNLIPRSPGVYAKAPVMFSSVTSFGTGLAAITALLHKIYSTMIGSHFEEAYKHWKTASLLEHPKKEDVTVQNQEKQTVDASKCNNWKHSLLLAAGYGILGTVICAASLAVVYFALKALLLTLIKQNLTPFIPRDFWNWRNTFLIIPSLGDKIMSVFSTASLVGTIGVSLKVLKTHVINPLFGKAKEHWNEIPSGQLTEFFKINYSKCMHAVCERIAPLHSREVVQLGETDEGQPGEGDKACG